MKEIRTLCVMGTFDSQANEEVLRIKEKLKAQGITVDANEPHVTFGIYTELEAESLLDWIAEVSKHLKRIPLCFNHFGFFSDCQICFLAPCSSFELLDLHSRIHKKYDSCCTDKGCLYSLKEKNWTPHMTLASIEPGQEGILVGTLCECFSSITAELTQIKITDSETSEVIGEFNLQG